MPATAPPAAPKQVSGFVPARESVLRCLGDHRIDLYEWNDRADRPVLLRDSSVLLSKTCAERLSSQEERVFYVLEADHAELCDRMLESLESLTEADTLSPAERFDLLQTAVSNEVDRSLRQVCAGEYVHLSSRVGKQLRSLVRDQELLPGELYAIARHDSSTFAHVTNVAGYATILAHSLGVVDEDVLEEIATGAMLHDIGKRHIPASILTKAGRLTPEERVTIQQHPKTGYEDLHGRDDVTRTQRMMVYQHHEHINGEGYPVRILGAEMHPWSRLLAVVDVFDALTGKRPYRKPISRSEALDFLQSRSGTQFDEEMVRCWTSALKQA